MTQTELEHLTVKRTLYTGTLNTYHIGQDFGPFRSATSRFGYIRLSKIGNAANDSELNLNI